MENQQQQSWYDNKIAVTTLCIFLFPVGLYGLWKNNQISKGWKIGVTVLISIVFLAAMDNKKAKVNTQASDSTSITENIDTPIFPASFYKSFYERKLKKTSMLTSDNYEVTFKSNGNAAILFKNLKGELGNNKAFRLKYKSIEFKDKGILGVYTTKENEKATLKITALGEKIFKVTLKGAAKETSFDVKEKSIFE